VRSEISVTELTLGFGSHGVKMLKGKISNYADLRKVRSSLKVGS
jgi:hypothetical protein